MLVALAAVLAATAPTEPADGAPPSSSAREGVGPAVMLAPAPITSGTAWNLAPRLRLYESGDNPLSPITFVDSSTLKWAHDSDCDDHSWDARPSEAGLANGSYSHWTATSGCAHEATVWQTNEYTAVGEDYDSPRPGGLEGFILNLDNELRDGGSFNADEPVVVRSGSGWIQYWYDFGDSTNRWGSGHEGDWEHIAIRLDGNVPKEVEFSYHHEKCTQPWPDAPKLNGNRPIVWLAKGSHGSYPAGATQTYGQQGLPDLIREGPLWDARTNLVRLSDYAWYPYKGSWGTDHVGYNDFGPSSPGPWRAAPPFTAGRCAGF